MKRLLLTLTLTVLTLMTWAQNLVTTTTQDNVTYNLYDDGTATMTEHSTPKGGTLLVPEAVSCDGKTYTVTKIADKAISNGEAKKVIVEAKVKSIGGVYTPGTYAEGGGFRLMTSVEEIVLPETLERIELGQFRASKIKRLVLPASVRYIGAQAFSWNDNLEEVVLPEGIETIPSALFARCTGLKKVNIPTTVKTIEGSSSMELEDWGTLNLDGAFNDCKSLTELVLPDGIESIAEDAFEYCTGLTRFVANGDMYFDRDGVLMEKKNGALKLLVYPSARTVDEYTVSDDVELLGKYAFHGWESEGAKVVNLPSSIKTVQGFYHSTVEHVNIAEGPTAVADEAFVKTEKMHWLELPSTITSIGKAAFDGSYMHRVILNSANPPALGEYSQYRKTYEIIFCVPSSGLGMYRNATNWSDQEIVAKDGIVYADNIVYRKDGNQVVAFGCKASSGGMLDIASSVTIEGTSYDVTSIGDYSFRGLNFVTVNIPASVTSIGKSAFEYCYDLQNVKFAEDSKLETIGESAFFYCQGLLAVNLPSSLKTLETYAFYDCQELTNVNITADSKLESIGDAAFYYCISLKNIYLPSMVNITDNVFESCWSLEKISVDDANTNLKVYDNALYTADGTTMLAYAAGSSQETLVLLPEMTKSICFSFDSEKLKKLYVLGMGTEAPYFGIVRKKGYPYEYDYATHGLDVYAREGIYNDIWNDISWGAMYGSSWSGLAKNLYKLTDEEADAIITSIDAPQIAIPSVDNAAYYTLDGKRILHPQKGIYIHNGRKVIVK